MLRIEEMPQIISIQRLTLALQSVMKERETADEEKLDKVHDVDESLLQCIVVQC